MTEGVYTGKLTAPFQWFGGKRRVASEIWARFGKVPNYCEPFFGSGAVLLARPHPPGTETINDADGLLANFWRAVQHDPGAVARYADWPVSEVDLSARHLWLVREGRRRVASLEADPDYYCAQTAGWWVWGLCQWIGSGWCWGTGSHGRTEDGDGTRRQLPHLSNAGQGIHRQLPHLGDAERGMQGRAVLEAQMQALSDRLRKVRICCGDWSRVVGPSVTERHGLTGVFLDPPYARSVRRRKAYANELICHTAAVREWALANGANPLLRIALCGYSGEGHEELEARGWECFAWKAAGGYGSQGVGRGRENAGRECIWFSPACLNPHRSLFGSEELE